MLGIGGYGVNVNAVKMREGLPRPTSSRKITRPTHPNLRSLL